MLAPDTTESDSGIWKKGIDEMAATTLLEQSLVPLISSESNANSAEATIEPQVFVRPRRDFYRARY